MVWGIEHCNEGACWVIHSEGGRHVSDKKVKSQCRGTLMFGTFNGARMAAVEWV
jgi:hypothetical protein